MPNIRNEDLLREIEKSIANDKITETLGRMFVWIAGYLVNNPHYDSLTYKGELEEAAMRGMVEKYKNFPEANSDNPFAFLMQTAKCAIKRALIEDIK